MVRLTLCYKDVVYKKDDKTLAIANILGGKSRSRTRLRSRRESEVPDYSLKDLFDFSFRVRGPKSFPDQIVLIWIPARRRFRVFLRLPLK